jgi:hypothetical protein
VTLSQVYDVFQRYHRSDQFVKQKYSLQSRVVKHSPVVKKPPPERTAVLFQTFPLTIFNQQNALALGTGVKQRFNGEDLLAL